VYVAPSEPCFEFWLLLHEASAYTTAQMAKCADVIPHLKSAFGWKSYSKNKAEALKQLPDLVTKPRIKAAERSAAQVRMHHHTCGTAFPANPSTDVDLLIHAINEALSPANKLF